MATEIAYGDQISINATTIASTILVTLFSLRSRFLDCGLKAFDPVDNFEICLERWKGECIQMSYYLKDFQYL